MKELICIAIVAVFIIDLAQFPATVKASLARWLGVRQVRDLRPFDCSLCTTWWAGLIWTACAGEWSLLGIAQVALVAWLTSPLAQALRLANDIAGALVDRLAKKMNV